MTSHAAYSASRISSNLKGSTKQFGWLQASATMGSVPKIGPGPSSLYSNVTNQWKALFRLRAAEPNRTTLLR
jgi:hypothetical protein